MTTPSPHTTPTYTYMRKCNAERQKRSSKQDGRVGGLSNVIISSWIEGTERRQGSYRGVTIYAVVEIQYREAQVRLDESN